MTKHAFIHIELPGAGSKSIQAALTAAELKGRDREWLCPAAGRTKWKTVVHHNLVFDLLGHPRFDPELGGLSEVLDEIDSDSTGKIVLSSSYLFSAARRPALKEKLRSELVSRGFHVNWVVYLKSYDEWLGDNYTEYLRDRAETVPFDEWLPDNRSSAMERIDESLGHLFDGSDSVHLRSIQCIEGSAADDFFKLVGARDWKVDLAETNGVSVLEMELFRRVSEFSDMHLAEAGRNRLMGRANQLAGKLPPAPPFRSLTTEQSLALRDETRPSYQALLDRAGITSGYDGFFPAASGIQPAVFSENDFDDETLAAFHKILFTCLLV